MSKKKKKQSNCNHRYAVKSSNERNIGSRSYRTLHCIHCGKEKFEVIK